MLTHLGGNGECFLNSDSYLPEPKSIKENWNGWIKATLKGILFPINNETFDMDDKPVKGDKIVPRIIIYKGKVSS